jgi:sugar-phosphatase
MSVERLTAAALLFDMDGVLVDSGAASIRVLQRWGVRHALDPAVIAAVRHGRKTRDTIAEITPQLDLEREVAWIDAEEMTEFDGIVGIRGAAALVRSLPPDRWAVVTSCGRELDHECAEAGRHMNRQQGFHPHRIARHVGSSP